jgi:hypothetical protein
VKHPDHRLVARPSTPLGSSEPLSKRTTLTPSVVATSTVVIDPMRQLTPVSQIQLSSASSNTVVAELLAAKSVKY